MLTRPNDRAAAPIRTAIAKTRGIMPERDAEQREQVATLEAELCRALEECREQLARAKALLRDRLRDEQRVGD